MKRFRGSALAINNYYISCSIRHSEGVCKLLQPRRSFSEESEELSNHLDVSDTSTAGYFIEILFLFCFHCFVLFPSLWGGNFSRLQATTIATQGSEDCRTWERNGGVAWMQTMQVRRGNLSANQRGYMDLGERHIRHGGVWRLTARGTSSNILCNHGVLLIGHGGS